MPLAQLRREGAKGLIFKDLHKLETRRLIDEVLGLPHGKIQQRGVYIFNHVDTAASEARASLPKYVGSSSQLAFRLRGYLNETHKSIGKLIPLIRPSQLLILRIRQG